MSPSAPYPDGLLARYRPQRVLGAGAMGAVWLAQDRRLDRPVAIKFATVDRPDLLARFEQEAKTLAGLDHPHIVRVLDHGEVGGQAYLVMEPIEGAPFSRLPAGVDPLPGWMQIGEALAALHARGIIHRDVKPSNAILDPRGRAVLLDFGLIRDREGPRLTKTGEVVGSLAFMAPEVLRGAPATPRMDWYSWGASLYRLTEGELPYETATLATVLRGGELPPPRLARHPADAPLRRLLEALLVAEPGRRPGTWAAIQAIYAGERPARRPGPAPAAPLAPAAVSAGPRPATTRRAFRGRALAAVALAAAPPLYLAYRAGRPPPAPGAPRGRDPTPPEADPTDSAELEESQRRLDLILGGPPADCADRDLSPPGAWRDLVDRLLDPRLPLALGRHLAASRRWLLALAGRPGAIEAAFRDEARAARARGWLFDTPNGLMDLSRRLRSIGERSLQSDPAAFQLGRKILLREEAIEAAVAAYLEDLDADLGRLPPLLAYLVIESCRGLDGLRAGTRNGRVADRVLALATTAEPGSPLSDLLVSQVIRVYLQRIKNAPATRGEAEDFRFCGGVLDSLIAARQALDRFFPALDEETRMSLLVPHGDLLRQALGRCPGVFQTALTSEHKTWARQVRRLMPAQTPETRARMERALEEFRRAFEAEGIGF